MPKEKILDANSGSTEEPTPLAQVNWGRDSSHVQLVTRHPVEGAPLISDLPEGNGWYVSLDRHGINHLIRTLRKARDQAFGKDE